MDSQPRKRSHSLHATPSISLKNTPKPRSSKKFNNRIDISLDSTRNKAPIESGLCNAIKLGNVNEVQSCLENSKYEANLPSSEGDLPLHLACIKSQKQIVEMLIDAGAHINSMDKNGDTPLHLACRYADDRIVEMLLKEFASTALVNQRGWTALEEAEERARRDDMGSRIYHIVMEASIPTAPTKDKEIAEPTRTRSRTYSVSLQKNQSFLESVVAWFRKL
ncbi:hypothetical protein THRCLA_06871 [Thraustotheca clavata]|uniref:Uncharacterized protein n=1 Tax=Thraustotheca clavata TaxID=74557 RepID=A0A1V9ZIM4_9STRA|nr:hypothetical protein THRCLA_06871 [Thraustotheca clavata]